VTERFEWRNLIELSPDWGKAERALLEAELDKLEPLHLMQETLRDIPLSKLYKAQSSKLTIVPEDELGEACCYGFRRKFGLHCNLMDKHGYRDEKGALCLSSLARVLLHELQHMIDPLLNEEHRSFAALVREKLDITEIESYKLAERIIGDDLYPFVCPHEMFGLGRSDIDEIAILKNRLRDKIGWHEQIAVARVNPTMQAFFDESPRACYAVTDEDEVEPYRLLSAQTNTQYSVDAGRNVSQPITEVCLDIKETYAEASLKFPKFAEMVAEKRLRTRQEFSNGSTRYY